jgi:hypothetical protein
MKIISCNYTGNIPGVGRGPVTNVKISDGLYNQLRNMGFALRITTNKVDPIVNVTKSMHVPSLEEKRAATLADTSKAQATPSKPAPVKKEAPKVEEPVKVEEKKEEVKVEEVKEVVESPVAEVAETPVEAAPETEKKQLTKEDLENLSEEELEALIPENVKRPVRYGKKWLLKTAVNYI